jgi:hypothetical protein
MAIVDLLMRKLSRTAACDKAQLPSEFIRGRFGRLCAAQIYSPDTGANFL